MVTEDKYIGSAKAIDANSKERPSPRREVSEKELKQLNELVELAENVSNNIDRLARLRDFCFIGAIIILTVIIYFIAAPFVIKSMLYIYLVGIALVSIFFMVLSGVRIDRKIKLESLILRDLLNIIHPFKEGVFRDTGEHIQKAIFRMKLSRIKFSNIEDPKEQPSTQKEQPTPKAATTP